LPFRILIADDHPVIRKVLRALIESHAEWEVCGEAQNGFAAVGKAAEFKPDLVIMDLAMPVMDGIRAAREISTTMPGLPILMHTMHGSPAVNLEAKKAGVSRVVSKGETGDDLISAIEDLLKLGQTKTVTETSTRIAGTAVELKAPGTEQPGDLATSTTKEEKLPEPD
jgi:DNA-binding NarL/FixJ family response regulator